MLEYFQMHMILANLISNKSGSPERLQNLMDLSLFLSFPYQWCCEEIFHTPTLTALSLST